MRKIQNEFMEEEGDNKKVNVKKLGCLKEQPDGTFEADDCNVEFAYSDYRIGELILLSKLLYAFQCCCNDTT